MNTIQGLHLPPTLSPTPAIGPTAGAASGPSFKDVLLESLEHVNSLQQEADVATQRLMTGEDVQMAEVLTAVQKADLSFRLMLQIRNKLVQAYQELKDVRI